MQSSLALLCIVEAESFLGPALSLPAIPHFYQWLLTLTTGSSPLSLLTFALLDFHFLSCILFFLTVRISCLMIWSGVRNSVQCSYFPAFSAGRWISSTDKHPHSPLLHYKYPSCLVFTSGCTWSACLSVCLAACPFVGLCLCILLKVSTHLAGWMAGFRGYAYISRSLSAKPHKRLIYFICMSVSQ